MASQAEVEPSNIISSSASSPFLKLPAELLNTIHEHTLRTDDGTIEISEQTGIPKPALLLTNKTIRGEALSIFNSQSIINLLIDSYSPSVPLFVHTKQEAILSQYKYKISISHVMLDGPTNWHNLIAWPRHLHEVDGPVVLIRLAPPLKTGEHEPGATVVDKEAAVIAGLFHVVNCSKVVHWDRVEETLGLM